MFANVKVTKYFFATFVFLFLQGAVSVAAEDASFYHSRGLERYSQKDFPGAIEMWRKEIDVNPDSAWAYYDIGVAYEQMGRYDQAFQWKKKAVDLNPDSGRFYWGAGISLGFNKDYEKALVYLKKGVSLGHTTAEAYGWISECYYRLGKFKEAEANLIEALKINPSYDYARGMLKSDRKAFPHITDEKIKMFQERYAQREAKRKKESPQDVKNKLKKQAELKERLLQIEEERKQLGKIPTPLSRFRETALFLMALLAAAVFYFKLWHPVYRVAGDVHFRAGRYEAAAKFYEKLLDARGGRSAPYDKLKEIYLKTGRQDAKAVHVLEKVYRENPEDKDVIIALANAYARKDARDELV